MNVTQAEEQTETAGHPHFYEPQAPAPCVRCGLPPAQHSIGYKVAHHPTVMTPRFENVKAIDLETNDVVLIDGELRRVNVDHLALQVPAGAHQTYGTWKVVSLGVSNGMMMLRFPHEPMRRLLSDYDDGDTCH